MTAVERLRLEVRRCGLAEGKCVPGHGHESLEPHPLPVFFLLRAVVKDVVAQHPVPAVIPAGRGGALPSATTAQINSSVSCLGHGVLTLQQKTQAEGHKAKDSESAVATNADVFVTS